MESNKGSIGFSFQEGEITILASTGGDIIWYWWGFALNQTAIGTGLGAAILSAIPALGANAIAHADRRNGVRITFLAGGIPIGLSSL